MGGAESQSARQVDVHGLIEESRAGVEHECMLPPARGDARFFQKFPFSARQPILAGIHAAGGQFPHLLRRSMAVLPDEQDVRLTMLALIHCEYDHRAAVPDDIATAGMLALTNHIGMYREDRTGISHGG